MISERSSFRQQYKVSWFDAFYTTWCKTHWITMDKIKAHSRLLHNYEFHDDAIINSIIVNITRFKNKNLTDIFFVGSQLWTFVNHNNNPLDGKKKKSKMRNRNSLNVVKKVWKRVFNKQTLISSYSNFFVKFVVNTYLTWKCEKGHLDFFIMTNPLGGSCNKSKIKRFSAVIYYLWTCLLAI